MILFNALVEPARRCWRDNRLMKPLLTLLLLCAHVWSQAGSGESFDLPIRAGKVEEVCMPLKAGTTLQWRFSADAPVDFNLHHHVGKDVVMPLDLKAVAAHAGRQTIDRNNDWCLMWTAPKAAAARVRGHWSVLSN